MDHMTLPRKTRANTGYYSGWLPLYPCIVKYEGSQGSSVLGLLRLGSWVLIRNGWLTRVVIFAVFILNMHTWGLNSVCS